MTNAERIAQLEELVRFCRGNLAILANVRDGANLEDVRKIARETLDRIVVDRAWVVWWWRSPRP